MPAFKFIEFDFLLPQVLQSNLDCIQAIGEKLDPIALDYMAHKQLW